MRLPIRIRAALGSLLLLVLFLAVWQLATLPAHDVRSGDPEYAALLGARRSGLPAPAQIAEAAWAQLKSPFHDGGMNDKGIAIQLAWSLGRVLLGFALAALVAVPLGFLVCTSPVVHRSLNPYVQLLKPISPLAWMPLALYTIKDSSVSSVFVISICSLWPMLLNTAHGVASLVIVAAEMLVGGTGIGYFVWNEWNNLSLANVIFALLMIGLMGMLLDLGFATLGKLVDRKSTRLNSSHGSISYAVFCL